jgi:hypothetical protein
MYVVPRAHLLYRSSPVWRRSVKPLNINDRMLQEVTSSSGKGFGERIRNGAKQYRIKTNAYRLAHARCESE